MTESFEAVIVGAGQAGLAMSRELSRVGVGHVVLEQGRVGESWRSGRWDTFALNTPGWFSRLPDDEGGAGPADEFAHRDAFIAYLDRYAARHALPIRSGVTVTSVEPDPAGGFLVRMAAEEPVHAERVDSAAGSQRVPRLPAVASALPSSVTQLHSAAYRNPAQPAPGAVLVVGSAQSGGQLAEDVLGAGRSVYLSTSRVGRVPRRYRGRDVVAWLVDVGFMDQSVAMLPNPAMQFAPWPIISGLGQFGHTLSLQFLAERGTHLLGHLSGAEDGRLLLADDLGANIAWADERSADMRHLINGWIAKNGVDAPAAELDPADVAAPDPAAIHAPERLDFDAEGISTVIWTTGVQGEFGWLPPGAVGPDGHPLHTEGVSPIPGLFFVGLPWQRNRASSIVHGAGPDAEAIANRIIAQRPTGAGIHKT